MIGLKLALLIGIIRLIDCRKHKNWSITGSSYWSYEVNGMSEVVKIGPITGSFSHLSYEFKRMSEVAKIGP